MKIKDIAPLMYDNEECEYICIQTVNEDVTYIGTLANLRREFPKALETEIEQMFTERYPAFNTFGLTIVRKERED